MFGAKASFLIDLRTQERRRKRRCGDKSSCVQVLPCIIKLVTLRGDFPALFPSLTPQSELVDNTYSCWLPNFERFLYYSLCRIVADDPKSTISLVLPWVIKLVILRCELETRPGLALGPLGAP